MAIGSHAKPQSPKKIVILAQAGASSFHQLNIINGSISDRPVLINVLNAIQIYYGTFLRQRGMIGCL
jgi:hypothetical protein